MTRRDTRHQGPGSRLQTSAAVMVLTASLAALVWTTPRQAQADIGKAKRIRIMKGVVMLVALSRRGGRLLPVGRGSGTIISSEGHILTNYHVVANPKTRVAHGVVAVALTTAFDRTPKPACLAYPARGYLDPKLDLAVIKCSTEVNGRPLRRAIRWPKVELGRSAGIIPGDNLYIVGYPAVGGSTISFFAGKVGGFLGGPGVGVRAWIKTDASVSPGVSGGAAFGDDGKLVGIPTRLTWRRGGRTTIGMVRPIDRARVLIVRAKRGATPGPVTAPVPGPKPAPETVPEKAPVTAPPKRRSETPMMPSLPPRGPPKPAPRRAASHLMGRLLDASTRRPIKGGVVLVVKPGVDVTALRRHNLRRHVHTMGVSNSLGQFRTRAPLPQGAVYGIIVLMRGYRVVRVNKAVSVRRGARPLLTVGVLRLQRLRY